MAKKTSTPVKAEAPKKERELLDAAMVRLERCVKADAHNRKAAIEDLNFVNGEQWDPAEKQRRALKGRPALQFNLLKKYVNQVVNDMIHNSPSIKVRPVDSKADINIAKIRQGIISNVEYLSNSKSIYGYAGRQQVSCGYGAWRVLTRYTEENPFLQEAYIESIRNPFLVYMDPDSKDQFYADAKYGFVLERMTQDDFKERYPKGTWPSDSLPIGEGLSSQNWYDSNTITVAEYITVESEAVKIVQLKDGNVVTEEEFKELHDEWREQNENLLAKVVSVMPAPGPQQGQPGGPPPPAGIPAPPGAAASPALPPEGPSTQPPPLAALVDRLGPEPVASKRRTTKRSVLRHRVITAFEVLEGGLDGSRLPGKFIPVVVVKGDELNIEGKNYVFSLIRNAKDPQKAFNYWSTALAEVIALAPKVPWLGTTKQFEGFENDYAAANVENFPILKYNSDPDAPGPPQRTGPPAPPTAAFEQVRRAEEMIKTTIGMFNADVGAPGSEQTGAAIIARQRPGDIGTFEFMNNMAGAIQHTGRILNEIIPEIYDSERDVRLRHIDETETFVPINTTLGSAIKAVKASPEQYAGTDLKKLQKMAGENGLHVRFNDITQGKYGIVVSVGPAYATQRQESAQALLQLMQSAPQQMSTALDLIVKNLDFKDSEEMEARLRKPLLLAGIVKPKPGETIPPPPPKDPEIEAAMIKAQASSTVAQMKVQGEQQNSQMRFAQEQIRLETAKIGLQVAIMKAQRDMGDTRDDATTRAIETARKQALEAERVALERDRLEHQRVMDSGKMALEAMKQFHERQKVPQSRGGA